MNKAFLQKVMDLDTEVYGSIDDEFIGEIKNMEDRFEANPNSFLCLMDGDTLAGYINFFPVCDELFDQIVGPVKHPKVKRRGDGFDPEDCFRHYFKNKQTEEEEDKKKQKDRKIKKSEEIEEKEVRIPDKDAIIDHFCRVWKKERNKVSYKDIVKHYNKCRDDDISSDEIKKYSKYKEENNIFIISVVISPKYRGKETSIRLTDAFVDFLIEMDEKKTPINSISAICVSEGGEKFLRGLNFFFHREIEANPLNLKKRKKESDDKHKIRKDKSDEEYEKVSPLEASEAVKGIDALGERGIEKKYHERVYLCWGYYLDRLKERRMYHKTHKDDIYLFVPLAENPENTKIDDLISDYEKYSEKLKAEIETEEKAKKEVSSYDAANEEKESDISPVIEEETEKEEEGHFYYKGIIPGSHRDQNGGDKKTQQLLDFLQYYVEYEYDGFIKHELERIYLGECLFRHMTDRYIEDEDENATLETVGEEKADLLLLAYRGANIYVLIIYLSYCKYSSSMVGDQLSKMKLERRVAIDDFGFFEYQSITDFLRDEYNLVPCGSGKAFYCMNRLPAEIVEETEKCKPREKEETVKYQAEKNQELMNILTGETFFSVHQDFYIKKYAKLKEQLEDDRAIYGYYKAFMSSVSLVMVLDTFDEEDNKVEDVATYVFIVELVLLQNASLEKLSKKVGMALEHEGNVPYEYISQLYKDYGRTLKLWDAANFKYYGTRMEAEQIRKALENDELRERYEKEQEFLENIVEVNAANDERRNGWILGIVGTLLAIFQVDGYIKYFIGEGIGKIAHLTGHAESIVGVFEDAGEEYLTALEGLSTHMFNVIVWGSIILFLLAYLVNKKRKKYEQRLVLRNEKDSENWED
ncbi:MAG: hypothetical protein IKN45_04735 [Lachnospiraceae bacterium]|nr:hypothetical protein [Lachnospiraceae bacterium]